MSADDDFAAGLAALKAEYRSDLAQQIRRVDELWALADSAPAPLVPLGELHKCLHQIAGSAGTFGFPQVGEIAAAAEALVAGHCERGAAPGAAERAAGDALMVRLRDAAAHAA